MSATKTKRTQNPKPEKSNSEQQALAQLEGIREMVAALKHPMKNPEAKGMTLGDAEDLARETIQQDPLSIEVRSPWYEPGKAGKMADWPAEFKILLCTGGPAVQLIGELDDNQEPERVKLQHQDWGTPWQDLRPLTSEDEEILLTYCREFYFGQ